MIICYSVQFNFCVFRSYLIHCFFYAYLSKRSGILFSPLIIGISSSEFLHLVVPERHAIASVKCLLINFDAPQRLAWVSWPWKTLYTHTVSRAFTITSHGHLSNKNTLFRPVGIRIREVRLLHCVQNTYYRRQT